VAKFWLGPWHPQQPMRTSSVERLIQGDVKRDFIGGTVYVTDSMGGWSWTIRVGGKIVDSHQGWGATTKHDGLSRAERAARKFDERLKVKAGHTALCPVCGLTVPLTNARRLKAHANQRVYACKGSGSKTEKKAT